MQVRSLPSKGNKEILQSMNDPSSVSWARARAPAHKHNKQWIVMGFARVNSSSGSGRGAVCSWEQAIQAIQHLQSTHTDKGQTSAGWCVPVQCGKGKAGGALKEKPPLVSSLVIGLFVWSKQAEKAAGKSDGVKQHGLCFPA